MSYIATFLALAIAGAVLRSIGKQRPRPELRWASWAVWGLALLPLTSISYTVVDQDRIGHLKRIYRGKSMPPGQIIAFENENGPQARILGPGFHLIPFVNLLYDVEDFPVVDVPQGQYGLLVAKDGEPLKPEQFMAKGWPEDDFSQMPLRARLGMKLVRDVRCRNKTRYLFQIDDRADNSGKHHAVVGVNDVVRSHRCDDVAAANCHTSKRDHRRCDIEYALPLTIDNVRRGIHGAGIDR